MIFFVCVVQIEKNKKKIAVASAYIFFKLFYFILSSLECHILICVHVRACRITCICGNTAVTSVVERAMFGVSGSRPSTLEGRAFVSECSRDLQ